MRSVVIVALASVLALAGAAVLASMLTSSPVIASSSSTGQGTAGQSMRDESGAVEAPDAQGTPTDQTVPPDPDSLAQQEAGQGAAGSGSGGPTSAQQATAANPAVLDDLLLRTNEARAAHQVAPLLVDATLEAQAAQWARQMAETGLYEHSDLDRLTSIMNAGPFGAVGENIHAPERQCSAAPTCEHVSAQPTSGTLHVDWMASPTHRINVLDGRWDRAGFGVFCAADGRMWAVALFASSVPTINEPILPNVNDAAFSFDDAGYTCLGEQRANNPSWRHPVGMP